MKSLILVRHAKSGWKDGDIPDHDRPLAPRGLRNAPELAARLMAQRLSFELLLSSSAKRTRATAEQIAEAYSFRQPFVCDRALYHASPAAYARAVAAWGREQDTIAVVGHNPGLQDWLLAMTGDTGKFPTAAYAVVHLRLEEWAALTPGTRGTLAEFWRPEPCTS